MRPLLSVIVLVLLILTGGAAPATASPEGQVTWGVHISLAPTWFDPAETSGIVTPFMVLYGLHDGMLKPLPGNTLAPALAESWTTSADGLVYEFVLSAAKTPKLLSKRMHGAAHDYELRDRRIAFGIATKLVFHKYLDRHKEFRRSEKFWHEVEELYSEYQKRQEKVVGLPPASRSDN